MQNIDSEITSMNAGKLKDIFQIDRLSDKYIEYTPLADRQAGFTVKRAYPANIRYKPPLTSDGKLDVLAIIRVVYVSPKEIQKKIQSSKIPIFLLISPFSRYGSNHYDYDFEDPDCPTKESVQNSKSTPIPIALESFDEYVYDHESNKLQTTKGADMAGEQILDTVFKEHCNTIHVFRGLKFTLKRGLRDFLVKTCTLKIRTLIWVLKNLFGRTLKSAELPRGTLIAYRLKDLELLKTEAFDLFGYKASKNVILVFSILAVIIYIVFIAKIKFLQDMMSNNLIAVCCAIVSLWLIDNCVPLFIFLFLNLLILLRRWLLFIRIGI